MLERGKYEQEEKPLTVLTDKHRVNQKTHNQYIRIIVAGYDNSRVTG